MERLEHIQQQLDLIEARLTSAVTKTECGVDRKEATKNWGEYLKIGGAAILIFVAVSAGIQDPAATQKLLALLTSVTP